MPTTSTGASTTAPAPLHPKGQFREVFRRVPRARLLPSRGAILAALFTFTNAAGGSCFPSQATLSQVTGYSTDTVGRAVRDLERAGLLSRAVPTLEQRRHHGTTHYQVSPPGPCRPSPRRARVPAELHVDREALAPAASPAGPGVVVAEQLHHVESPAGVLGASEPERVSSAPPVAPAARVSVEPVESSGLAPAVPGVEPDARRPRWAQVPRAPVPPWRMPRPQPQPQPQASEPRGSTVLLGAALGRLRALVALGAPSTHARTPTRHASATAPAVPGVEPTTLAEGAAEVPSASGQGPPSG